MKERKKILETIDNNMVTVIQGETGSGKTTQVPQFLLEHCAKFRKSANIVVTQPRRLATTAVCHRVCKERDWNIIEGPTDKSIVGYQVGLDKNVSEDTRLTFMTTGVLLRKLIAEKNLSKLCNDVIDIV